MMGNCINCEYWLANDMVNNDNPYLQLGWCRRHSPQRLADGQTLWPQTQGMDSCGDWEQTL